MVQWHGQGETEIHGQNPTPLPLCPTQIPHRLAQHRIRASTGIGQRLSARVMARSWDLHVQVLQSSTWTACCTWHFYYKLLRELLILGSQCWEEFRPNNDIRTLQRSDLVTCKTPQKLLMRLSRTECLTVTLYLHMSMNKHRICVWVCKSMHDGMGPYA